MHITAETLKLLVAFGENSMKKSNVFELQHKRFKDGREHITDDLRSGQPKATMTDANVVRV